MSTTCQVDRTAVPISRLPARNTGRSHTVMQINIAFIANTMQLGPYSESVTKLNSGGSVFYSRWSRGLSLHHNVKLALGSPTFPVIGYR
jgi:hypothetical protein